MDKKKLIKFLNLSQSLNDGEALSSIRKANFLLKEEDFNWEEIIIISDSLESIIKRQDGEYVILHRDLLKERAYSQELTDKIRGLKNIIKYIIIIFIFLLIIITILK